MSEYYKRKMEIQEKGDRTKNEKAIELLEDLYTSRLQLDPLLEVTLKLQEGHNAELFLSMKHSKLRDKRIERLDESFIGGFEGDDI
jgi:hypothetical protein